MRNEEEIQAQYELLPCPFCGGVSPDGAWEVWVPRLEELQDGGWRVICYSCSANVFDFDKEIAVAKWNKRFTGETSDRSY